MKKHKHIISLIILIALTVLAVGSLLSNEAKAAEPTKDRWVLAATDQTRTEYYYFDSYRVTTTSEGFYSIWCKQVIVGKASYKTYEVVVSPKESKYVLRNLTTYLTRTGAILNKDYEASGPYAINPESIMEMVIVKAINYYEDNNK